MATLSCSLPELTRDLLAALEEDYWNEAARGEEVTEILFQMCELAHDHFDQVFRTDRLVRKVAAARGEDVLPKWEAMVLEDLAIDIEHFEHFLLDGLRPRPVTRELQPGEVEMDGTRLEGPVNVLRKDIQRARNLIAFCGGGEKLARPLSPEEVRTAEDELRAAWGE